MFIIKQNIRSTTPEPNSQSSLSIIFIISKHYTSKATMLFSLFTTTTLFTLSLAAPTSLSPRWPQISNILRPSVISQYSGVNGAIVYNTPKGVTAKTSQGDLTTLVTFENTALDLPASCRLRFYLDSTDSAVVTDGTKLVNIFSSLKPAPVEGSAGWGGPGNQRNLDIGRFLVYKGGNADLIQGGEAVPCPKKGEKVGYEVVPVGDVDRVEWSGSLSGLYLTWN